MTTERKLFQRIGANLKDVQVGNLFGKPCFKINGKAFICFFQNEMVFKLRAEIHSEALGLDAAKLFDPSGKKRPMKEWVQVPSNHQECWTHFAQSAYNYVLELSS